MIDSGASLHSQLPLRKKLPGPREALRLASADLLKIDPDYLRSVRSVIVQDLHLNESKGREFVYNILVRRADEQSHKKRKWGFEKFFLSKQMKLMTQIYILHWT